jgi:hypothetical protein
MMYWKGHRRTVIACFKVLPKCMPGTTRDTTKTLSQDIRPLGSDFNLRPLKYEAGVQTYLPQR